MQSIRTARKTVCLQSSPGIRQNTTDVEKGKYALEMMDPLGSFNQDFELIVARYYMIYRYHFNHFTVNVMLLSIRLAKSGITITIAHVYG